MRPTVKLRHSARIARACALPTDINVSASLQSCKLLVIRHYASGDV
jgi:hypothetical protein